MSELLDKLRKDRQRAESQERMAFTRWRNTDQHLKKLKDAAWLEWEKAAAKDIAVSEAFEQETRHQNMEALR